MAQRMLATRSERDSMLATLLTRPTPRDVLVGFFTKVKPRGPGWKPVTQALGQPAGRWSDLSGMALNFVLGCAMLYSAIIGIGRLILGPRYIGVLLMIGFAVSGALLLGRINRELKDTE
ncbi:MAG: hypothetical protein P9M14_08370 [Candidatus Alcyoniella australis]|nr:hypothetical protein [Candidatus Alcyoniella australis]